MAIITISRGSLSGGAALAERLGQQLGADVISYEAIVEAARRYGVSEAEITEGLQRPPSLWHRLTHHKQRYLVAVQATLADMVAGGNAVYHGLAGQLLLRELPGVIKVRLIAPVDHRVRAAMAELELSPDEAREHIRAVDEERARWVRLMFDVEWTDPSLYDLVINLDRVNLDEACELVATLAAQEDRQATVELHTVRQNFALQSRVRAELILRAGFPEEGVTVRVHQGRLQLTGPFFAAHPEKVLDRVRQVTGAAEALPAADRDRDPAGDEGSPERGSKVADVMLPADAYPAVLPGSSVRQAITALSGSSVKLADGHVYQPRFVLVRDGQGRLVGVLSRRALLRALVPQLAALERARKQLAAVGASVSDEMLTSPLQWLSLFGEGALTNAEQPVEPWVAPVRCAAAADDDLSSVVSAMLQHEVDLMPVLDRRTLVGVVLMTDVFDAVAQFIIEAPARRRQMT